MTQSNCSICNPIGRTRRQIESLHYINEPIVIHDTSSTFQLCSPSDVDYVMICLLLDGSVSLFCYAGNFLLS